MMALTKCYPCVILWEVGLVARSCVKRLKSKVCTADVILFTTEKKKGYFENSRIGIDVTTDQAKSYMRLTAVSGKGDGRLNDGLNTKLHLLIL